MTDLMQEIVADVRYIKENMVTYREYDHLHNEFHNTKAKVDGIIEEQHKRQWMVNLGEKAIYVILGAVLIMVLKASGFVEVAIG